jgi:hypothetical protein
MSKTGNLLALEETPVSFRPADRLRSEPMCRLVIIGVSLLLSASLLDAIAQAAGTDCKPNDMGVTCDASNNTEFLTALETIRTSVTVTRTETRTEILVCPMTCSAIQAAPDVDVSISPGLRERAGRALAPCCPPQRHQKGASNRAQRTAP